MQAVSAVFKKLLISNFIREGQALWSASSLFLLLLFAGCHSSGSTPTSSETSVALEPADVDSLFYEAVIPLDSSYFSFRNGHIVLDWKVLAQVDFVEKFNEQVGHYIMYPKFSRVVKMLDRQRVEIRGYIIPVDETGLENVVVLSAFPFANCFFCGNAGPESIMEVHLKQQSRRFKMDEQVTFRGTLRLNDTDVQSLNYILEAATPVQ